GSDVDLWWRWWKWEWRRFQKQRHFCGQNRYDHLDDERHRDEVSQPPGHHQQFVDDLQYGHEMRRWPRCRQADLGEASDALVDVDELQYALSEKDAAGHQANQNR